MRILVMSGVLLALSGCLGPVSLHQAVLGYDRAVGRIEWELLLLNIARLRDGLPVHTSRSRRASPQPSTTRSARAWQESTTTRPRRWGI
jgi:hypothetical protein